jgi:purine-nucleoside phosphorylase
MTYFDQVSEAAAFLRANSARSTPHRHRPRLRPGRGGRCRRRAVVVPYAEIPHFPQSTVEGHSGRIVAGLLGGVPGRRDAGPRAFLRGLHAAAGHLPHARAGRARHQSVVLTNAAGGIAEGYRVGQLVALADHINLMGFNPLAGPNEPRFAVQPGAGLRFFDMTEAYSKAPPRSGPPGRRRRRIPARDEGIYLAVSGPSFETPAEIRAFRTLGARWSACPPCLRPSSPATWASRSSASPASPTCRRTGRNPSATKRSSKPAARSSTASPGSSSASCPKSPHIWKLRRRKPDRVSTSAATGCCSSSQIEKYSFSYCWPFGSFTKVSFMIIISSLKDTGNIMARMILDEESMEFDEAEKWPLGCGRASRPAPGAHAGARIRHRLHSGGGHSHRLCAVLALALRLNLPAIQAANYAVMPLQLVLIVPFVIWAAGSFLRPGLPSPHALLHASPLTLLSQLGGSPATPCWPGCDRRPRGPADDLHAHRLCCAAFPAVAAPKPATEPCYFPA